MIQPNCQPEPFQDFAPLKMWQSLWQISFLGFQGGKIGSMLLCIRNEQYDVIFTVMMS